MIDLVLWHVLPAAYEVLPKAMESDRASALLLAIGLQESKFLARRQLEGGPARGFWQFERGAVRSLLRHPRSGVTVSDVLEQLRYDRRGDAVAIHAALEHNDVLAACLARCLLWTDYRALPMDSEPDLAWLIYATTWNPGAPRPAEWPGNFAEAWDRLHAVPGQRV